MSLPEAVKEAERIANEAEAAWDAERKDTGAEASTLDELDDTDDDQTDEGTETQDATEEDEDLFASGGGEGDDEQQVAQESTGVDYKQRYNTLLGKYNAEVPRLTRDLDYLRGQVEAMARSSARPVSDSPEGGAPVTAGGYKRHLKKEELDEYDSEILDFQSRLARGEAESVMTPAVKHLMQRLEYLEGRVQHEEQDSLWSSIEKQHPGAKSINDTDPLFADFLNQYDPASGRTYKEIGEAAYSAGDVGRVASLFDAYAGSHGGGGGASAPPNGRGKASPPVKPSRSNGGSVRTTSKEKPTLRESEINVFFSDVARGKYAGRDKEMKNREAIIEAAVLEGRIRPG